MARGGVARGRSGRRQAAPQDDVASVGEEGQQEEDGGADVGAADDAGHGLGVHRMGGEEESGHGLRQGGAPRRHEGAGRVRQQRRAAAVQQHVDQVVAEGTQLVQPIVEAEREDAQRPVRLVRAAVRQRRAPKVVEQHVAP